MGSTRARSRRADLAARSPTIWIALVALAIGAAGSAAGQSAGESRQGRDASESAPPPPRAVEARYPDLFARFETQRGEIVVRLGANQVPQLVAHFVNLVERGWYDDLRFHAVAAKTQIHTGDPTGTGDGGCGYTVRPAFHKSLFYDTPGTLGLWSPGGKVGAQLIITIANQGRKYNLRHPGIGQITEGLDVAEAIRQGDTLQRVRIEGDATLLRADFASEILQWNAVLDAEDSKKRLRPAPAPANPAAGDAPAREGNGRPDSEDGPAKGPDRGPPS